MTKYFKLRQSASKCDILGIVSQKQNKCSVMGIDSHKKNKSVLLLRNFEALKVARSGLSTSSRLK
jgi:hypothetical protein